MKLHLQGPSLNVLVKKISCCFKRFLSAWGLCGLIGELLITYYFVIYLVGLVGFGGGRGEESLQQLIVAILLLWTYEISKVACDH